MARLPEFTLIGVITSAHGIRGQVKIRHFLDNPQSVLSSAAITNANGSKQYKITIHSANDTILIAAIDGVSDRNAAELLKGTELYVNKSILPEADDGSWYYNDLIGLAARLSNGNTYGEVIAVHNFGAGDIVEIKKMNGELEMLPFNDQFVGEVDIKSGFLIVIPPEYVSGESRNG